MSHIDKNGLGSNVWFFVKRRSTARASQLPQQKLGVNVERQDFATESDDYEAAQTCKVICGLSPDVTALESWLMTKWNRLCSRHPVQLDICLELLYRTIFKSLLLKQGWKPFLGSLCALKGTLAGERWNGMGVQNKLKRRLVAQLKVSVMQSLFFLHLLINVCVRTCPYQPRHCLIKSTCSGVSGEG